MALSDLTKGGDTSSPKVAVSLETTTVDPVAAMRRFIKALKADDAHAAYDAYCLLHEAHEDEQGQAAKDDDEDEY